jgi:hypothetical protein
MNQEQREAVRQRLRDIEEASGGVLTPAAVVADAKRKDSPLHAHFEWDKTKAAYQHWLDQARELIVSVRVVFKTDTTNVSSVYYVRDPAAAGNRPGYVSVERLRGDADAARDALVSEFSRIADLLRRARELAAVLNASSDVEALLTSVVGLRERFMSEAAAQQ